MELAGKAALVTGGARRVGRAICLALAERGARVAIHCNTSRREADELAGLCPGSVVLEADLADARARAGLVPAATAALGGLDVLVNNASVYESSPLERIGDDLWDRTLEIDLKAPFFLARDAGLAMRERGGGAIVNVTDWGVERPDPDRLPYFAAKAGLTAMTRGLARALAPRVRVNAVAPGPVLLPEDADKALEQAVLRAVPLGRLGGPGAVAGAVVFLVGSDFLTGQVLTVDGGRSVR